MRINLDLAAAQAARLQVLAGDLRSIRAAVVSFHQELGGHWRGQEVTVINSSLDSLVARFAPLASTLDGISADIMPAALEVRRQEDLAIAQSALTSANANVSSLQSTLDNARRRHDENPTPSTLNTLNSAEMRLNNAINERDAAAARVRSLTI